MRCTQCFHPLTDGEVKVQMRKRGESETESIRKNLQHFGIHISRVPSGLWFTCSLGTLGELAYDKAWRKEFEDAEITKNMKITCISCKPWPADPKGWRHK
ncbi:MAG: hypothetical protein UY41_C0040G0016 [Candidatus Moranbacteria bacterium GW2011_GWE1_49_15]|nr:MAG: hypothetical protein UY41_C0040G0016 [Candidatus Moranbacteria bacterium GW2011_GWE1_49_15]